jgi:DNA uptake protein ComE-like DNA-binding protein
MKLSRTLLILPLAGLALTACGQSETTTPTVLAPTASSAPTGTKVSANDASKEELVVALEAGGIANASKWADEIVEYRPYSASDESLATLSGELAKYNASPETIAQIISLLEL